MKMIILSVVIWWIASSIASITTKRVQVNDDHDENERNLTPAFTEMWWIEITALQHIAGTTLSWIWIKLNCVNSKHYTLQKSRNLLKAVVANVVGSLAINAAYFAVSSSMTLVIKSCEPLFTTMLMVSMGRQDRPPEGVLFWVVLMVVGACISILSDTSFNVWGVTAAIVSNIAFSARDLFSRDSEDSRSDTLNKYITVSAYSFLILFPVVALKYLSTGIYPVYTDFDVFASSVCHFMSDLASRTVLQATSAMVYTAHSISKNTVGILANVLYFANPVSSAMATGLVLFLVANLSHQTKRICRLHNKAIISSAGVTYLACLVIILYSRSIEFRGLLGHYERTLFTPPISQHAKPSCLTTLQNSEPLESGTWTERTLTAWMYTSPMSSKILENIQNIHRKSPGINSTLLCGTSLCVSDIDKIGNKNLSATFVSMKVLLSGTPLAPWLKKHPFHKVIAGRNFQDDVQFATKLGALWKYGGLYVNPMFILSDNSLPVCDRPWVLNTGFLHVKNVSPSDCSCFPPGHPYINLFMENFVEEYQKVNASNMRLPAKTHYLKLESMSYQTYCQRKDTICPEKYNIQLTKYNGTGRNREHHPGSFPSDQRVHCVSVPNVGDELRLFPGLQFVPYVDRFVDRDSLEQSAGSGLMAEFFNGRQVDTETNWWPPRCMTSIFTSFHADKVSIVQKHHIYTRDRTLEGFRDQDTHYMSELGINAHFSASLALMLRNPYQPIERSTRIHIVEVGSDLQELLPAGIRRVSEHVILPDTKRHDILARFKGAFNLLEKYATAKLVITQNIHAALTCVAMGTPVIFINSPNLSDVGASDTVDSAGVGGLTPLFHTLDLHEHTPETAKKWLDNFNWIQVPQNPGLALLMRVRATLWNIIRQDQFMYESSYKLGVVPFEHPHLRETNRPLFHLIFTTSNKSSITVLTKHNERISGVFNRIHWRALESIFYHNPDAQVIIHSNTLRQRDFNILTEVGYDLEIRSYNLSRLIAASPARGFSATKLDNARRGKYWYSHETDLLRLLILYKYGGVYMDTDVIVTRPFDTLPRNVLGWEDGRFLNGAFMMFEEKHVFLQKVLEQFEAVYTGRKWNEVGPALLTKVWKRASSEVGDFHVTDRNAFYLFRYQDIRAQCFADVEGETFEEQMEYAKTEAYVVHLYSKMSAIEMTKPLKDGTICKYLLNKFCIFCDVLY